MPESSSLHPEMNATQEMLSRADLFAEGVVDAMVAHNTGNREGYVEDPRLTHTEATLVDQDGRNYVLDCDWRDGILSFARVQIGPALGETETVEIKMVSQTQGERALLEDLSDVPDASLMEADVLGENGVPRRVQFTRRVLPASVEPDSPAPIPAAPTLEEVISVRAQILAPNLQRKTSDIATKLRKFIKVEDIDQ